jgi:hypothetical protein
LNNEFENKRKMKQKKKSSVMKQVKAARKQSREEEIRTYGKLINYRKVMTSKKQYNRKKNKADDEVLPYLFSDLITTVKRLFEELSYQIETRFSTGTNIGSPAFIPNALYHADICGRAPFTRHLPSE